MEARHTFRLSSFRVWLVYSCVCQVICLFPSILFVLAYLSSGSPGGPNIAIAIGFIGAVSAFLWTFYYSLVWKIDVVPEGIYWRDYLGRYHWSSWKTLVDAKRKTLPGLHYALIATSLSPKGRLMPLFIEEKERFAEWIVKYAGYEHPFSEIVRVDLQSEVL